VFLVKKIDIKIVLNIYLSMSNISTMASEGKKVRAEFKKAFDTKDVKKIEQIGKRKKIEDMISLDIIIKYLNKAAKNDELYLCHAMLDGICEKYNHMDLFFGMVDSNNAKLIEELLNGFSDDISCALFDHAIDRGRLTIAELIYPSTIEQYDDEFHEIKSYSRFKEFVENNWFTIDENDMSKDGFILAIISNRNDLVKKILRSAKINLSARDNFALTYACDYGYAGVVKTLLKHDRSCFYADDKYAYKLAIRRNYVDMVNMMERIMGIN